MSARQSPRLAPLPDLSRSQSVTRVLRTAITNGEMAPGDRLLETELALQLGTSNGPVRDALRQLETEGLVIRAPYRGAVVADVSEHEIKEVLIPVRIVIERFAFSQAISALSEDDLQDLRELIEKMRLAADTESDDELAEADVAFHELVVQRAAEHHCLQLWRVIQPRVRIYFQRDAPIHPDRHAVAHLHEQLLEAIQAGDVMALSAVVESHIRDRPVEGA